MNGGAFEQEFAKRRGARGKGEVDPSIVAAASDHPAEAAVIGALLRDDALFDMAGEKLRSEDFTDYLFGDVFGCIMAMSAAGETASAITVARRLFNDTELTERGGAKYLAQLAASDSVERGPGYIDHLVDLSRRRFVATALGEVRPWLFDTGKPLSEAITGIDAALSMTLRWTSSRPAIGLAQAWDNQIKHIRAIGAGEAEAGKKIAGLTEWNEITGGLVAGNFVLLGGRPSMGKTSVALHVARGAAEAGHGVLFISREMTVQNLMFRMVTDMLFEAGSSADMDDVKNGRISIHDYDRAAQIRERIDGWPLVFEEPEALNAARIGPMVRRHQKEMAARGVTLALVVVDYLGLLDPPRDRSNREQEVSEISRTLKGVANSTGTTVLALSQLSRALEQREDKRPQLSDLRDSGSLEQDADAVVFVYRAQYYLERAEPKVGDKMREAWEIDMQSERDRLELHGAKNRQGESLRRRLYFYDKHQAVRPGDFLRSGGWGQPQ
ncbi:MAG: DnaB-like helicase C-terminal domain-containing protein [Sphingobium limneticum]